jgi:hypothetical protein
MHRAIQGKQARGIGGTLSLKMTAKTDESMRLAVKMVRARDTMRRMNSDEEYAAKIAQYQSYITRGTEKWGVDRTKAAMRLLEASKDEPLTMLGIMAALVEMEEAA